MKFFPWLVLVLFVSNLACAFEFSDRKVGCAAAASELGHSPELEEIQRVNRWKELLESHARLVSYRIRLLDPRTFKFEGISSEQATKLLPIIAYFEAESLWRLHFFTNLYVPENLPYTVHPTSQEKPALRAAITFANDQLVRVLGDDGLSNARHIEEDLESGQERALINNPKAIERMTAFAQDERLPDIIREQCRHEIAFFEDFRILGSMDTARITAMIDRDLEMIRKK